MTTEAEVLWVLMKMRAWDSFEAVPAFPVSIKPPTGCCGYLMVFDSHAAAVQAMEAGDEIRPIQRRLYE